MLLLSELSVFQLCGSRHFNFMMLQYFLCDWWKPFCIIFPFIISLTCAVVCCFMTAFDHSLSCYDVLQRKLSNRRLKIRHCRKRWTQHFRKYKICKFKGYPIMLYWILHVLQTMHSCTCVCVMHKSNAWHRNSTDIAMTLAHEFCIIWYLKLREFDFCWHKV